MRVKLHSGAWGKRDNKSLHFSSSGGSLLMRHGRQELCNISAKRPGSVSTTVASLWQNVIKRKKWLIWTDGGTGSRGVKEKTQRRAEEKRPLGSWWWVGSAWKQEATHTEVGGDTSKGAPEALRYRRLRSSAPPVRRPRHSEPPPLPSPDVRLETLASLNHSLVTEWTSSTPPLPPPQRTGEFLKCNYTATTSGWWKWPSSSVLVFLHKCTLTLTPEGQSQQSALTCLHLNAPIGEIRLCCPVQQVAAHTERRLRYTPAALKCLLVIVVFSVYVVRVQMSFCKLQLSEASFIFTSIGRNQVMNPKYCMYCQAPHMHWTLNCKTNTPSAFTHLIWSCSKMADRKWKDSSSFIGGEII